MTGGTLLRAGSAAELLADEAALHDTVARYGAWVGAPSLPVAAALAFKAYAWTVVETVVTGWLTRRRVADHRAARVAVTGGAGGYRLTVLDRRLAVLTGDPLAGSAGVVVAADETALREELRVTLVDGHLAPAVEAFRRLRGGGSRPLWGSAVQWLAYPATVASPAVVGDRHAAVAELLGLLPPEAANLVDVAEVTEAPGRTGGDGGPGGGGLDGGPGGGGLDGGPGGGGLDGGAGAAGADGQAGWRPLLLRRTCCYAYALPSLELCTTCCVLDDAGRDALTARHGLRWRRRPA